MNILLATPYFYPKPGGLENYSFHIAKALAQRGHTVTVVTSNHAGKQAVHEVISGVTIHRLPRFLKLSNTPVHYAWPAQLKRIITQTKPHVINAHTPVPFMSDVAERVRGTIPFVLTYHNDLVKPSGPARQLAKAAYGLGMQKTLNKADHVIVTSDHYAKTSPYLQKRRGPVAIVPPGVDTTRFNLSANTSWLKQKYSQRFTVLFVGQMDKSHDHKGLGLLITACAQLQNKGYDLQLVAVGGGDGLDHYTALAKQAKLQHFFLPGFVPDTDLPKYFAGADVHVLPSTTSAEGFGMVLIEANSCGTAVIGSRIGGIGQAIIENHTGILIAPHSASALAKAIATLHNDPQLRTTLGQNGAARAAKDFDWQSQATKTEAVFTAAVQGRTQ